MAEAKDDDVLKVRAEIVSQLENKKVESIKLQNNAVIIDSLTDPKKAIEILVKNKVRAAPVIDQVSKKFIGVLDLRDTLKYVLQAYKEIDGGNDNDDDNKEKDAKTKAMEYLTGESLKDLCKNRPFRVVNDQDSFLKLAEVFSLGSHVVGVVNKEKKLIGVITQGSFFQLIAKDWVPIPAINEINTTLQKILDLKYITSPIKTVSSNIKAYESFELMNNLNLSGLAVVNEKGILIHNTSATDIKLWLLKGEQSLNQSIEQFIIKIRNLALTEKYPITVCQLNDKFKRAIGKLKATKLC